MTVGGAVIARLGGVLLLPCYFIRLSGVILHLRTSTTVNISGLCQNESLKWKSCLSTQLSVDVGFVAGFLYLMFSCLIFVFQFATVASSICEAQT